MRIDGTHVVEFLSTPSARRATREKLQKEPNSEISIHALREEGDVGFMRSEVIFYISIHALREEGDVLIRIAAAISIISIHALREEGDGDAGPILCEECDFYPRPPRGGRRAPALAMV